MQANQILQSDILDILFDGKNKAYGAYELRKTYNKRIASALIIMISMILLFSVGAAISAKFKKDITEARTIIIPESVITKISPKEIKVLPPPAAKAKQVATKAVTPPIVIKDELVKVLPPAVSQIEKAAIDLKTVEGAPYIDAVAPPSTIKGSNVIATVNLHPAEKPAIIPIESEAMFPGGPQAWQRYIEKAIMAQLDEFSDADYGTCLVKFMVDEKGLVSKVRATTMIGSKLAEIAVNAIRKGPAWTPAIQNGHFVNAWRLQPVTLVNPNQ